MIQSVLGRFRVSFAVEALPSSDERLEAHGGRNMKKVIGTVAALSLALVAGATVQGQSKITIWTDFGTEELKWFSAAANAFEKTPAAKGAKLEVVAVPLGENRDKFIQSAPKGEGPDLIATIPHDQVGQFASAGVLEPMDKYLTVGFKADVAESGLDAFNYKGRTFGIPMFGEAVALIYNKKLLPGGIPKTWDEFIKVSQNLTNLEKQQFGFLSPIGIQYHMHGFYRAFGAYVFGKNKDGSLNINDIGLANAGAVKAAQMLNDLRFKFKLIPEGAEDDGLQTDLFAKGNLAMWLNGPWKMADIKKAKIDYGIGLPPRPTGATQDFQPFIGVRGVVMNAYSKQKAITSEFAKFLVSNANQVSLFKTGGRLPISKSAVRQLGKDPVAAGFGAAIAKGIPMPNIPEMGQVWGPWGDALNLSIKTANADIAGLHAKGVEQIKAAIIKK
ncbi:MAG: maltose ABC transporter substrate-binding protein [Deinococcales bacterium]